MRDKIFFSVCFGFGVGVLLRSFFEINFYVVLFFALLALAAAFISRDRYRDISIIISIFIFSLSLGILRFHLADKKVPEIRGENFTGIIVDEPDMRENNQKLAIQTASAKILATTDFSTRYKYGDEVSFSGEAQRP